MPDSNPFPWKNYRVLIADDEPDMRDIFASWFRNLGCEVCEAADGKAALELTACERFDAIVTDVRMPRLDGIQLVRALRQSSPYVPVVIFISGFTDLTLPDAFDLGVESVLSKPCERADLVRAVQRSLLRRQLDFTPLISVDPPLPSDYIRQDFSTSLVHSDVALGRGGFSFNVQDPRTLRPTVGFSLTFAEGSIARLAGWGLFRWCEPLMEGHRVGIEFCHLERDCLAAFRRWLEKSRPPSFIPKASQQMAANSVSR